jgi:hypothetical protein
MRKTPAVKSTPQHSSGLDPIVSLTPLTDLQRISGDSLRCITRSGREVMFGQIDWMDALELERELGSSNPLADPGQERKAWTYMALLSLRHHQPDAQLRDIADLFRWTAVGIERMGQVVASVLPLDEPADEPASAATGDSS